MHFQLVALSFTLLSPVINAYPITGDTVNCRSGPGTSYSVVKSYKKGADVAITCQASGTDIKGDSIWDKTADGCYVADYYVKTGSSSYVTKKCDGSSGGGGGIAAAICLVLHRPSPSMPKLSLVKRRKKT